MKSSLTTNLRAALANFETRAQTCINFLETRSTVSLRSRHRLVASTQDLLSFAPALVAAVDPCVAQFRAQQLQMNQQLISQRLGITSLPFESDDEPIKAFASTYKAMFFFIRGLQDALYGVMLEISGGSVGAYSSMNDCLDNESSPVFKRIMNHAPAYADWFRAMRAQRDKIKWGVSHAPGWEYSSKHQELFLNLYVVRETGESKSLDIDEKVTLSDVTRAINESINLIDLVEKWIREITTG